jgi:hypothetical protein
MSLYREILGNGELAGRENWKEVDRQSYPADRYFCVSNSDECCFIRLTQTEKNNFGQDSLWVVELEIFGTLLESPGFRVGD